MIKIDWGYLRRPLVLFVGSIIISATLIVVSYRYEMAQRDAYESATSTLRSTHELYRNIVNDIDLLEQYRSLYGDYKASGLVGKERRLSWIETLEATNSVLRLPTLTYSLQPQEVFERPRFTLKPGVEVFSSPMELNIGLLHEEDLFALLEGLRLSIRNLVTVDHCSLERGSSVDATLSSRSSNLSTRCLIRWVTIDAK